MNDTARLFARFSAAQARARGAVGVVARQPSWLQRTLLATLFVLVGIPLLIVAIVVAAAFAMLFIAIAGVEAVRRRLRGTPRVDGQGRENVRVIRHTPEQ